MIYPLNLLSMKNMGNYIGKDFILGNKVPIDNLVNKLKKSIEINNI